ncbi:regulator of cell morphogenesis and NO signaling [Marinobacter daqiaonensis]|uniref:Regulator of cell morphogenesis and NO signaling n=1 Tax=Marinobacter daqiaonensis TaxID=650891 RepID=A0A1I6HQ53_9GAMM|nr:hemerythrin domain-containing protein [Marinobacter daqiaonensis]SFR56518.1 regulator of cell morphogenesis and NO signaling [Marinobacter daqiaonensis]
MNYQDILGSCHETTLGQLASRCPKTLEVFRRYMPEAENHRQATLDMVASIAGVDQEALCRELFDTVMEQTPLEELDTDVLIELILQGYDAGHLEQLPKLHRLARKIEAIHRAHPAVPKGITLAIKELEHSLSDHIEKENAYVLKRMEHDPPPNPDTPIAQMNEEHTMIKSQLHRLREMTGNYRLPESACRSWRRFYRELRKLDFRLSEQIYLERDILFPRFQF